MNYDQFQAKLEARFDLSKHAIKQKDIEEGIRQFSESDLDALWDAFHSNYDKSTSPTWASVSKIAKEANITRSTPSKGSIKHWVYKCDNCGTYFGGHSRPADGQKCTGCKKLFPATLIVLNKDENPFNLNKREFDNIAGNLEPVPESAPHPLSLGYKAWLAKQPLPTIVRDIQPPRPQQAVGMVSGTSDELF